MRIAVVVLGIIGGLFALLATNPGSVTTTTDMAVISCWVTLGAGGLAIIGGLVTALRMRLGAALMGLALIAGGLAAPGTIPAIQDMLIIPYFAAAILVLLAVVLAVLASRKHPSRAIAASL